MMSLQLKETVHLYHQPRRLSTKGENLFCIYFEQHVLNGQIHATMCQNAALSGYSCKPSSVM